MTVTELFLLSELSAKTLGSESLKAVILSPFMSLSFFNRPLSESTTKIPPSSTTYVSVTVVGQSLTFINTSPSDTSKTPGE